VGPAITGGLVVGLAITGGLVVGLAITGGLVVGLAITGGLVVGLAITGGLVLGAGIMTGGAVTGGSVGCGGFVGVGGPDLHSQTVIKVGRMEHRSSGRFPDNPSASNWPHVISGCSGDVNMAPGFPTDFPSPQTEHCAFAKARNDNNTRDLQSMVFAV
jgi:hypothetical protein